MKMRVAYAIGALALLIGCVVYISDSLRERISLALDPSAAQALSYGLRHLEADAYDIGLAQHFFETAVRIDPSYPQVHQQLARVHFLNGEYELALREINAELAAYPDAADSSTYYIRGLIEGYLKQYDAAVSDYRRSVALNPGGWEGRVDLAWVLIKTEQYDEARTVAQDGLTIDPHNPWLQSVLATALFEQGDAEGALAMARKAKLGFDAITPEQWLEAYPGNSPYAADVGIATLREAAAKNVKKIEERAAQQ